MSTTNKLMILLLALMLAGSSVAFSAHVSSHSSSETGLCSLCTHAGSPNTAITDDASVLPVKPVGLTLTRAYSSIHVLPVFFCIRQSRAPPGLT